MLGFCRAALPCRGSHVVLKHKAVTWVAAPQLHLGGKKDRKGLFYNNSQCQCWN